MKEHIAVYGADNHLRLTGAHEKHNPSTSLDFWNIRQRGIYQDSDRYCRKRMERLARRQKAKFPAANPYKVASRIIKTVKSVKVMAEAY